MSRSVPLLSASSARACACAPAMTAPASPAYPASAGTAGVPATCAETPTAPPDGTGSRLRIAAGDARAPSSPWRRCPPASTPAEAARGATDAPKIIGQSGAMPRDVLQHHLEDQARHGVQIGRERLAPEPQRLQRDRSAACEPVHYQRRLLTVRRLHQVAPHLQVGRMRRHVPVGERADEPEQRLLQLRIVLRRLPNGAQDLCRLPFEPLRTMRVARVRQQQRQQYCPARRQRPARPPQMQRRRMPVADRFLPRRVLRHNGDGKVHLGQALALARDHTCSSAHRTMISAIATASP